MHSADTPPPASRGAEAPATPETKLVQVVCWLTPEERQRFAAAAERHGAGTTSGQVRVLIREWMRGLNPADADQVAA